MWLNTNILYYAHSRYAANALRQSTKIHQSDAFECKRQIAGISWINPIFGSTKLQRILIQFLMDISYCHTSSHHAIPSIQSNVLQCHFVWPRCSSTHKLQKPIKFNDVNLIENRFNPIHWLSACTILAYEQNQLIKRQRLSKQWNRNKDELVRLAIMYVGWL